MATREEYKLGIDVVNPAPSGTGGDLIQDNFKTIADLIDGQNTALSGKAAASHSHSTSDVSGLDTALSGKAAASHTHSTSDVSGLDTALSGKAAVSHTHSYNDLSDKPTIPAAYTLPTASTSELGGVKVDGTTITIENGVISAPGSGGGGASTLSGLTDVGINNPQTGEVLTFTGSAWQNVPAGSDNQDNILNRSSCYNTGTNALAINYSNNANGNYSFAGGEDNEVNGVGSAAFGFKNKVGSRGRDSLVIGNQNVSNAKHALTVGQYNKNNYANTVSSNSLDSGYYTWDAYQNNYGNCGFKGIRMKEYSSKVLWKLALDDIFVARIDVLLNYYGTLNAVSYFVIIYNQQIQRCTVMKMADEQYSSENDLIMSNGNLMYSNPFGGYPDMQIGIFYTIYSNTVNDSSSNSSSSSSSSAS